MSRLDDALKALDDGHIEEHELAKIAFEEGAIDEAEYKSKVASVAPEQPAVSRAPSPASEAFTEAAKGVRRTITPSRIQSAAESFATSSKPQRLAKSTVSGAVSPATEMGGAAQAIGLESIGESITKAGEKIQKELYVPDPTFAEKVASGFGSMATFLIPGIGTQTGAARLALVAPRLARWFGVGVAAVLEAAVEAGSVFNEVLRRGGSRGEAFSAANKTFWSNLPTLLITNRLGIFGEKGNLARRAITSSLMEGSQEVSQEIISNIALNDPVLHGALEAGAVGAIVGGGTSTVLNFLQSNPQASPREVAETLVRSGIPEDEALTTTRQAFEQMQSFQAGKAQKGAEGPIPEAIPATGGGPSAAPETTPPVPESPETLRTQIQALSEGRVGAVLATPGAVLPDIPQGFQSAQTDVGTFVFDPRVISGDVIKGMVQEGTYGDLLGHVAPKPEGPAAVVEAKEGGVEAKTSVVPPEAAQAQAQELQKQFPGATVEVGGPEKAAEVVEEREISQALEQPHPETGKKPFEMGREEFVELAQKDAQEGGEDLTAAQALDVQRSVVEKAVESGKEVPPQIIEELGEAPAGEADISFEPGEFERPEPVGNLADLTPEEFSRRFPKASPEVHKASVRQALLIGKEVPKESLGAYRDVVEDLEREGRQEALEKEEKELIQAGKTPLTKFVVERGGINIAQAYKAGFRGELENVRRPGVMRRKGGSTISNMSETAFEAGVIPEQDEILFLNRLDEESRPSGVRERIEFRRAPKEKEHEDILKAKKRFGTTDLFEEAGYITPDGSLLDFSGKKQGGQQGTRELDHREVNFVVSKSVKFKDQPGGNTAGMRQFMSYGNIRFSPVSSGLELSRPPTFSLLAFISKLVRERNGEVTLDVVGDDGNGIFSREYPKGTAADEIVEDINRAFGQEAVSESKIAYGTNDPAKIDRIISETSKEIAFTPQQLELEFESSGIPGELRLKGFVDFRGTPVKNIRQVAEVIASLRHPKLEYFQVVFVKNGKVVGHQVFSTGLPNAVLIPDQLLGDILAEAKKLGAEVYLGHNHPSGNHLPSAEDRLLTRKVAEGMKGNLKGHIVTDDKNFSFIKSDGTFEEIEYLTPKPELKKFGEKVQDRDSAALIAKKHSDGKSTLVLLASSRHDLIAVETVPKEPG